MWPSRISPPRRDHDERDDRTCISTCIVQSPKSYSISDLFVRHSQPPSYVRNSLTRHRVFNVRVVFERKPIWGSYVDVRGTLFLISICRSIGTSARIHRIFVEDCYTDLTIWMYSYSVTSVWKSRPLSREGCCALVRCYFWRDRSYEDNCISLPWRQNDRIR